MQNVIKNVVFDMGQVMLRFDREEVIGRLGLPAEDEKLLMNEVFLSKEWEQMDWGEIIAGTNIIRFVPPLVITREHVDEMTAILRKSISEVCGGKN